MDKLTRETVIIVHGTWASPQPGVSRWYQLCEKSINGFVTRLDKALEARGSTARCWAHCPDHEQIFHWSGENDWVGRTHAAAALRNQISKLQADGWRCHIVAHSHGGNIVDEAISEFLKQPTNAIGKVVTLGTPFINAIPQVNANIEKRHRRLGVATSICSFLLFLFFGGRFYFDSLSNITHLDYYTMAFVMTLSFILYFIIKPFIHNIIKTPVYKLIIILCASSVGKYIMSLRPRKVARNTQILSINSDVDEAWQVLSNVRDIKNPLSPKEGMFGFVWQQMRERVRVTEDVARIHGATSWSELNAWPKNVLYWVYAVIVIGIFLGIGGSLPTAYEIERASYLGALIGKTLHTLTPIFAVMLIITMAVTHFLGPGFFSALWWPFRWCVHRVLSIGAIPTAIGTYVARKNFWTIFQRIAFGLDGYTFGLPQITKRPNMVADELVRYEEMPNSAVTRALTGRSAWIARHLGDVSETFSKPKITAPDITALLRLIESDQTLVHGAYYTDNECIERIADFISGIR